MSTGQATVQPGEDGPSADAPPEPLRCPRCDASLRDDQDWCLECGAPARTRLAPAPNWRVPAVVVVTMIVLAGAAFAFAFVRLTDDGGGPAPSSTVTAPPGQPGPGQQPGQPAPGQQPPPVQEAPPAEPVPPPAPAPDDPVPTP
ncbi:MAG: hypothetical protein H0W03_00500 [Solirubrobacterales bacterium]|nr:hypothetical protein [Solirubrobacterales bacterium]